MCIFTSTVAAVTDTRIFIRMAGLGRQYLAYEMSFASMGDTAMVLPLPVASRDEATAVRFIDLSGTPDFFDRINQFVWMFEELHVSDLLSAGSESQVRPPLLVHEVGAFEASFVPSIADFDRLDARFRLASDAWAGLPQYRDYGFAVFKLRATGEVARHAHPMALEFSTRLEDQLFAPTVHIHDGTVQMRAWFDHVIYAQVDRWNFDQPAFFENGVRQKGDTERAIHGKWAELRPPGDWRLPRQPHEGARRFGLMLPARSEHPLGRSPSRSSEETVEQLRTLGFHSCKLILKLCQHAQALAEQCRRFTNAIWEEAGGTEEERAAFPRIGRWMDIGCTLRVEAETLRRWKALTNADRELALRNKVTTGRDAAAHAWMALHDDTRERFGRIHRWDDLPPMLDADSTTILQWMERHSEPRREKARLMLANQFFPFFDPVPESLLRTADAPDRERDMAIRDAVPTLEPDAAGKTAHYWLGVEPGQWSWSRLAKFAELARLWPLFDATREIHALGLSGALPNRDTLINVN